MDLAFVFVFFIEMLISFFFFGTLSERKFSFLKTLIIGTSLFEIGAVINIFLISTVWLNNLMSIIINAAFSLICFKMKPLKSIFYANILVVISTLIEMSTVFLISSFTNRYLANYQSEVILIIVEVVSSKILYFLVTVILIKFVHKDSLYVKIPIGFYIYPITSLITVISLWYICIKDKMTYDSQVIISVISVLLLFSTVFLFFSYQYRAKRENQLVILQQEQDKNKTDLIYYEVLEEQNNNLRTYAHDAKNHLMAIQNLNNDPEIENYISKLLKRLADYSNVSHSGNRILDVIINKYITECRLKEILFEFDVKNNNLSDIEYYDIVTILTNLLDNAVEASEKSDKKYILLETDYRNNFSVIIITNSCNRAPTFDALSIPKTTKENKLIHGVGIKSVKKTLKKYSGDVAFEYNPDNKLFSATIMLQHINKTTNKFQ